MFSFVCKADVSHKLHKTTVDSIVEGNPSFADEGAVNDMLANTGL